MQQPPKAIAFDLGVRTADLLKVQYWFQIQRLILA